MSILYIAVSLASGIIFGLMDGFANANPLVTRLYGVYNPLAGGSLNIPAGVVIDIIYGFLMAGIFQLLYESLPGEIGVLKGFSYALLVWFFRVVMSVVSQWVMFNIPLDSVLYTAATGLVEMLVLGLLYGLLLRPES